jgi:hypothetical protein
MSDPTNEPSREPIREPTKRMDLDAVLPNNLSSKKTRVAYSEPKQDAELPSKITDSTNTQTCGLCHDKNSEQVMFSNHGQDNEIQSNSTDSSNTQPSNGQGPKQRSLVISAHVPCATFYSNLSSGLNCWVHSHTGCEPVTSSTKVSCSVFTLLARETVTFMTRVSCNTFTSLVCELVTFKNKIKGDKSTPTFQLVVGSVSNNNASFFDNKPSSTFQLVVASVDCKSKAVSNKPFRTLRLNRIKSKMPFTFQLIVGSKQVHQRKPQ